MLYTYEWAKTTVLNALENGLFPSFREGIIEKDKMCAYRGNKGRKCAIGCLIPDEEYNESMEGASASSLLTTGSDYKAVSTLKIFNDNFLNKLQIIHDDICIRNKYAQEWTQLEKEEFKERVEKLFKLIRSK